VQTRLRTQMASCITMSQVSGFTLIEVMTVLVIGGILAAISMPYFFSRATAAKQAEGKMLTGVLNRAQQSYYMQNAKFSDNVESLAVNLRSKNYILAVAPEDGGTPYAINYVTSTIPKIRSYVGMAAVIQDQQGNQTMQSILCEAKNPGTLAAAKPTYSVSTIDCAPGTHAP